MKRTLAALGLAVAVAGCTGGEDDKPKKGTVTVHVTEGGAPKAGAHVLFHSRSGSLVEQFVTTSDGTIAYDGAHIGGSATVLVELVGTGEILTIGGLDDGDEFDVAVGEDAGDVGALVGTPDVNFGPFAGAADYFLDVGCSSEATITTNGNTAPIYEACTDGSGDADLFAVARDSSDQPLAYAFVEAFRAATTNSVQLPAWSSTWTDAAVGFTGLPAETVAVLADIRVRGVADSFGLVADGIFGIPAGGSADLVVPVPQGFGNVIKRTHVAAFGEGITSIESASIVFQDEATLSDDVTLNFATDFFPPIGLVENVSDDQARPVIEWTEIDLTGIDAGIVNASWNGAEDWTWGYFVPPELVDGSIQFPELPEELAALVPPVDASIQFLTVDADFIDSFDELKALDDFDLENPGVSPAKTKVTLGGTAIFGN